MAGIKWGYAMKNVMIVDGEKAVIEYDPEIEMFRGEFIGLNGGADFYAKAIDGLHKEGSISLKVFLDACKKRGIKPGKSYSGKFNVRVSPKLHAEVATAATAEGKSLNQWIVDTLNEAVHVGT